jgi:hypothetical protein
MYYAIRVRGDMVNGAAVSVWSPTKHFRHLHSDANADRQGSGMMLNNSHAAVNNNRHTYRMLLLLVYVLYQYLCTFR